jgi:CRP-like cAMP-binding protein
MFDEHHLRVGREAFLVTFGMRLDAVDSWAVDRMTAIMEEVVVRGGDRLIAAGNPAEFVYFMQQGEVRCTGEGSAPFIMRGRWIIGMFDAIGERSASRTVAATRDFVAMRVPALSWVEILEDSFESTRSVIVGASRSLAELELRLPTDAHRVARDRACSPRPTAGGLGLTERLACLLGTRMLRRAGVQALADLAGASHDAWFEPGDPVLLAGARREHLVLIVEGNAVLERDDPPVQRECGPGDFVCAAGTLGRASSPWHARALERVRAIQVPLDALFDLMEDHFDVVQSIIAALADRRELVLEQLASSQHRELVLT